MSLRLPEITSYSADTLKAAQQVSPAINRYLKVTESSTSNLSDLNSLRYDRHKHWLKCALATLTNSEHPQSICRYWSDFTNQLLDKSWKLVGGDKTKLALFSVGKLGAGELNLSSDIDIMFVCAHTPGKDEQRFVREFIRLLTEGTEFGFCYRVDTDLRPGGRMSPLICSVFQFEDYYWTQGLTWERVALVRLAPVTGDPETISQITEVANKFCYRKYLDYTLFEDIKALRSQIRNHYYHTENEHELNLKLSAGGIRDIELYINALQVIHGGRASETQVIGTSNAISALKKLEILNAESLSDLENSYWKLRREENLVQSINDQQTHIRKETLDVGPFGAEAFDSLQTLCLKNERLVSSLLDSEINEFDTFPSTESKQRLWLEDLGYSKYTIDNTWPKLLALTARSSNKTRDEKARRDLLSRFTREFTDINYDKDLGLSMLTDFIHNTRAKTSFFTLLLREPNLIGDLALLFSTSPYLGGVISSRPELIDSYLYRQQDPYSNDTELLLEELTERRQLTEIIGTLEYWKNRDTDLLTKQLSSTADEICHTLLSHLISQFGPSEIDIICLGKWASNELGLQSDLDLVFITNSKPTEVDFKIAKRFISYLTQQYKGGQLYSIDLRLRPSGKAGPILLSEDRLLEFLANEAEGWQRQAYLRARVLSGRPSAIQKTLIERGLDSSDLKKLQDIREKLKRENLKEPLDLKYANGGLVDIEFAAQTAALYHQIPVTDGNTINLIEALMNTVPIWKKNGQGLTDNYAFIRSIEQMHQVTCRLSNSTIRSKDESSQRLCRFLKLSWSELEGKILASFSNTFKQLKVLDPTFSAN